MHQLLFWNFQTADINFWCHSKNEQILIVPQTNTPFTHPACLILFYPCSLFNFVCEGRKRAEKNMKKYNKEWVKVINHTLKVGTYPCFIGVVFSNTGGNLELSDLARVHVHLDNPLIISIGKEGRIIVTVITFWFVKINDMFYEGKSNLQPKGTCFQFGKYFVQIITINII